MLLLFRMIGFLTWRTPRDFLLPVRSQENYEHGYFPAPQAISRVCLTRRYRHSAEVYLPDFPVHARFLDYFTMSSQDSLDTKDRWLTNMAGIISSLHLSQREIAKQAEILPVSPPTTPNSYQGDPRLVLLTDRQREMVWYYETFGVVGLCYWIYHIALAFNEQEAEEREQKDSGSIVRAACRTRRRAISSFAEDDYCPDSDGSNSDGALTDGTDITNSYGEVSGSSSHMDINVDSDSNDEIEDGGHKSWRDVRDDFETGEASRMLYGIASLPPDLIPAILYGDLPLRMQDKNFFSRVGPWVDCGDEPGVYGAFVAVSPITQNPVARSTGGGPCLEHILKAIDTMRLYTDLRNPDSCEVSKKIDRQFDPAPKVGDYNYAKQRKFAGGADRRSFGLLDKDIGWLHQVYHEVEKQIRSTDDLHLSREPMRSPVYVGMSSNPSSRGPRHKGRPDSKLMGLFLSTLKYLYGDLYEIGVYTYQLFRGVREDDIGFLEIVASIMGSGFPWDGGLAYTYAGGKPHGMHGTHQLRMRQAAKRIRESGNIEFNARDSAEKIELLQQRLNLGVDANDNNQVMEDTIQQNQNRADELVTRAKALQEVAKWIEMEKWFIEYES